MARFSYVALAASMLCIASSASATIWHATSANFSSIFYAAASGDRILLSGQFGALQLNGRSFTTPLQIDARGATFTDSLFLKNVSGVNFSYGHFGSATTATRLGRAVFVSGGDRVSFTAPTVVGNGGGGGIYFTDTSNAAVRRGTFTSLGRGVALQGVSNGVLDRNRFLASSSDGAGIIDSHFVTASNNLCSGTNPSAGAHPDCIQLWSLAGNPVQSDITIINNTALGATQGFTSFDPDKGGGLRISFLRNHVDISYSQAIACYACVDSIVAYNVVTTRPGAAHQARINIVGGANNNIHDNSIGDFVRPASSFAAFNDGFAEADSFDSSPFIQDITPSVPEPETWLELIAGIAAIGIVQRRRPARVAA